MAILPEERIHLIISGADYDRIEEGMKRYPGSRLYVVANQHPIAGHVAHDKEVAAHLEEIARKNGYWPDRYETWKVNYYDFKMAFLSFYRFYTMMELEGKEVVVNITGGTKLVAIAATLAALFARPHILYFIAKNYSIVDGAPVSRGFVEVPIPIGPLFAIGHLVLPDNSTKKAILNYLRDHDGAETMAEIIGTTDKRKVALCSYHLNEMEKEGLVGRESGRYRLTDLGDLVSQMSEVRLELEKEVASHR